MPATILGTEKLTVNAVGYDPMSRAHLKVMTSAVCSLLSTARKLKPLVCYYILMCSQNSHLEKAENDQKNTILTPPELLLPRVNWVLLSACVCNYEVLWKLISVEGQPRILLHAQLAKFSSLTSSLLPLCFRPQESLPPCPHRCLYFLIGRGTATQRPHFLSSISHHGFLERQTRLCR